MLSAYLIEEHMMRIPWKLSGTANENELPNSAEKRFDKEKYGYTSYLKLKKPIQFKVNIFQPGFSAVVTKEQQIPVKELYLWVPSGEKYPHLYLRNVESEFRHYTMVTEGFDYPYDWNKWIKELSDYEFNRGQLYKQGD